MLRISLQRFAQHESAILRVCFTARLRSALARVSRAASDFCRPETGIGVVAREIFETVNFPRGNVDDGDTTRVRRVARFLFSVKRDASSIRRDRREDAVRHLFLTRSVESRYPDNLVSLKTRCADRRKKLRQDTLRAQKGGACFLSW